MCTLGYSSPVYGQKIVLGVSGRIPYAYWRIAKTGACARFHEMVEYLNEEAQKIEEDKLQEVRVSVFGLHLDDS